MERNRICLNNITQGGVACKNPTITWTNAGDTCLLINCVDDNCVTVQVPDGCTERCVTFILDCEDCDQCPPVIITRCLCDDNGDCGNCEDCVTGFCTPVECPDQVCDPVTGDCVDCYENGQCPCDQECIANQCQCPDPSQFVNDKGCCVDCLTNDHCPECHNCVGGTCVPVVCPDGICNPDTNGCVECLIAGDCTGDNECCIGNRCACCPGFFRNAEGDCVEIPQCNSDDDCPACFVCVDGECAPQVCPDGKVCVDGECVDECDCEERWCPAGKVCVPHFTNTCYCKGCEGACTNNGDCGEGCVCVNGQCQASPCYGPCQDGNDCGQGCGCVNNECTPCASFTCSECEAVNGCSCTDGVNCADDPCTNFCTSGDDCIGADCGCDLNALNCISCESVSCAVNGDCPQGCYCDNGVCRKSPCANVACSTGNDCGPGCGCDDGECVPCFSLGCETAECADVAGCACNEEGVCGDDGLGCTEVATLAKQGDCGLRGELETGCCACSDMFGVVELEYVAAPNDNATYVATIDLQKDGALLNASPNIAEDYPLSGGFRIQMREVYRRWSNNPLNPGFINGTVTGSALSPVMSVANNYTTTHTFTTTTIGIQTFNIPAPNKTLTINGQTYRIWQRTFSVYTSSSLQIVNECVYSFPNPGAFVYNDFFFGGNPPAAPVVTTVKLRRDVKCRAPLFTLYKANTAAGLNAGTQYKNYALRVGTSNVFRKDYTTFPEVEYGKFYRLDPGCGCAEDAFYSCNGNNIPTPLTLCTPSGPLAYTLSDCGKTLTFDADVSVTCPAYLANGAAKPVYDLYLNGVIAATYTLAAHPATVLIASGATASSATCITSVVLKQRLDTCELCNITQSNVCNQVTVTQPLVSADCDDLSAATVGFSISGGTAPYTYEIFVNNVSIDSDTGVLGANVWTGTLPLSGVIQVVITDDAGCEAFSVPFFYNLGQNDLTGQIAVTTLCNPRRVRITNNAAVTIIASVVGVNPGVSIAPGGSFNFPVNSDGSYSWSAYAVGNSDCPTSGSVNVACCTPDPFASTSYTYNACAWTFQNLPNNGIGVTITLNGDPLVNNNGCLGPGANTLQMTFNGCVRTFEVWLP
jgi:hypothetical protein